jgi:ubiquitin conjugation factor E4 B
MDVEAGNDGDHQETMETVALGDHVTVEEKKTKVAAIVIMTCLSKLLDVDLEVDPPTPEVSCLLSLRDTDSDAVRVDDMVGQVMMEKLVRIENPDAMIDYLLQCYERSCVKNRKRSLSEEQRECNRVVQAFSVSHTTLILQDTFCPCEGESILVPYLLGNQSTILPSNFLVELLVECSGPSDCLHQVFGGVADGLVGHLRNMSLVDEQFRQPMVVLSQLAEIKIGTARPFCQVLANHRSFLPPTVSTGMSQAREIQQNSILGPLMALTAFPDESPSVVEHFFSGDVTPDVVNISHTTLRNSLHFVRNHAYSIIHNLLLEKKTRSMVVTFLQTVVNSNRQRAHMTYRMKDVSDDGFIINFLSVMQQLAVKVRVNQVA